MKMTAQQTLASRVPALAVQSCLGGSEPDCDLGPALFRRHCESRRPGIFAWHNLSAHDPADIQPLQQQIATWSRHQVEQQRRFLLVGGDHSCAMGTWCGVMQALQARHPLKSGSSPAPSLGLIWIDAHMDAHTFATTPSGNIHGMPIAALLGKADPRLQSMLPYPCHVAAENLVLIGVRSYEAEEKHLLASLGVKVVEMGAIHENGLAAIFQQVWQRLCQRCTHIGISLDLDGLDPVWAPAVETPISGGLDLPELLAALAQIRNEPAWCGLEMVEFSPGRHGAGRHTTLDSMQAIVDRLFVLES